MENYTAVEEYIMNKIIEPLANVEIESGKLSGEKVITVSKKLGDLVNVFRDDDLRREMNQDQVIYRVQAYLPVDEGTEAGLFFYTSIIYQGKVGD